MILVVSDIHGNLEAFNKVLERALEWEISKIINLGDIVDYGADSLGCIDKFHDLGKMYPVVSVRGNHDAALLDDKYNRFRTEHARQSFDITKKDVNLDYSYFRQNKFYDLIQNTKQVLVLSDGREVVMVHGTEEDPCWGSYGRVELCEGCSGQHTSDARKVVLCGHSHIAGFKKLSDGTEIINPGSVGQPRNGNPSAQFIVAEDDFKTFYFMSVDYDIEASARKIVESGRPPFLATRLYLGI